MYGYGYGHPGMMGPPGHHMGGGHHHMGGGGGMRGGGSTHVPFRAGDWRCGAEGCNYHNFAKNVSCLRCGASRASAALVADSNYNQNDASQGYGMGQQSMQGTPGPAPYAPQAGGYPAAANYPGQQYAGPPQSTYALPSGLGAGTSPYPAMSSAYGHGHGHNPGMHSSGGFDSRAEAAFSAGQNNSSFSNGGGMYAGEQAAADPFTFLSSGLSGLSVSDDARRNGANPSKSPA